MSKKPEMWRDSYDYRSEYFRRNPGMLGCIWICSQCGRPLWGKDSVQVDHIIPPSAFARRKLNRRGQLVSNTSFLARAMNSSFNTAAICPKCNLQKSNKMGGYVVKGSAAKVGEIVAGTAQKGLGLLLFGLLHAVRLGVRLVTAPLRNRSPVVFKLAYILFLLFIVLYFMRG